MQWMLLQEKFLSVDKEFAGVKLSTQQIINSLQDVLTVLENLEDVHVTGDKLASEVRNRIFTEIDRWNDDRHDLDDALEDIRKQIAELGETLHSDFTDHTSSYEQLQNQIAALSDKLNPLQEALKLIRGIDCRNDQDGSPLKIGSGDWFRWHAKKGFSGLMTTIIVALLCAILIPLFCLFVPGVGLLHSLGH